MKWLIHQNQKGFTVVELLIVIVIIAILATISIVAFRGIQQRANSTTYLSAVRAWEEYLRYEAVQSPTGKLPNTAGPVPISTCLGRSLSEFPEQGLFDEGECVVYPGGGSSSVIYSESMYTSLELESRSDMPSGKLPHFKATNADGAAVHVRGIALFVFPPGFIPGNPDIKGALVWESNTADGCGRGIAWHADSENNPFYDSCMLDVSDIFE